MLLAQFVDPLFSDKSIISTKMLTLFKQLLNESKISFFCPICNKKHSKGKNYQNHKNRSDISPIFPKIPEHSADVIYHQQIVGIYYTGNGHMLKNLPKGTVFRLKAEPNNRYDSKAVSVWHETHKLGYIPQHSNSVVFSALSSEKVTCIFGKYRPSYRSSGYYSYYEYDRSEFSPERADITIHIFNAQKFNQIMNGFLHLISLSGNNPSFQDDIVDVLYKIGYRTIKILENQKTSANIDLILSKLYSKFKIQIPNSEFSILL